MQQMYKSCDSNVNQISVEILNTSNLSCKKILKRDHLLYMIHFLMGLDSKGVVSISDISNFIIPLPMNLEEKDGQRSVWQSVSA